MAADGRADAWRRRGSYFSWAPRESPTAEVNVFHVEAGPSDAPVLLLVHGFPTCSIDWFDLVDALGERFRICALDFPGYGFSDKPIGWGYSLGRDSELLEFYVREIVGADALVVLGHDRGSSVALKYALEDANASGRVEHLVLTNGNIYLPLSNLTEFQRLVLDPDRAPAVLDVLTPAAFAAGMGLSMFSPPRSPDDPDVQALTATFAHADGIKVLHETIQYLRERAGHEREWLESLSQSAVPTTVIWGLDDTVSPPRVATHVWSEFLMHKPGRNRFYLVPGASHYLQVDRPDALTAALLHTLDATTAPTPGPIGSGPDAALLIDVARPQMPAAVDLLEVGGGA